MEGLLIDGELRGLQGKLPARRHGWRFPDAQTFVLPLASGALWLYNRPPNPRLELRSEAPAPGRTHSGFQDLLVARATGDLVEVRQHKLDRLVYLEFAASHGFVDSPPVTLVAELTGRNCNLVLLDESGTVLGAAREIGSTVNRFRQVVAGARYRPPPPYDKLDPRVLDDGELARVLGESPLSSLRTKVDGIGPQLTRALAAAAGVPVDRPLDDQEGSRLNSAFTRLVADPQGFVRESLALPDAEVLRRRERRQELEDALRRQLQRSLEVLCKRIDDLERTRSAAASANDLRRMGDLLLAFANRVPEGATEVKLPDFSGMPRHLTLDPAKSATANAQDYYERARKRESRARQADAREPELIRRRDELSQLLAGLPDRDEAELRELAVHHLTERRQERRSGPGIRYRSPQGYEVLVGRNSRENDEITFKVGRSRDIWLHVQGYRGSHVIIRAENREVPFETILYAARLAAAYSKAGDSENVPVDYTLRKNVWKVKGQPAGAVHFTQQKTVYVTPSRQPAEEQR